jgi:hypothetical protein
MTSFVAALGCIKLPREVDADTAAIAILFELCTDIDTTVCGHLYVAGVEDVVGKNSYAEASNVIPYADLADSLGGDV